MRSAPLLPPILAPYATTFMTDRMGGGLVAQPSYPPLCFRACAMAASGGGVRGGDAGGLAESDVHTVWAGTLKVVDDGAVNPVLRACWAAVCAEGLALVDWGRAPYAASAAPPTAAPLWVALQRFCSAYVTHEASYVAVGARASAVVRGVHETPASDLVPAARALLRMADSVRPSDAAAVTANIVGSVWALRTATRTDAARRATGSARGGAA